MLVAHISDLHLGRQSPGDPHGAERLKSFRLAVATLAAAHPDALLIAGDTFDDLHVELAVIEEAANILAGAKDERGNAIPVVLIPGNHDPADAERLWTAFRKALGSSDGVHLVLTPTVISLAEGQLLVEAYPCATRFSAEPPWEPRLSVPQSDRSAVRVVLAHGTLQGGPVPEGENDAYPFTQTDLEALAADYVALGHFHGLYPAWGDGDECRRPFCYCGTHEPDQFAGDAGYAVLATVVAGQAAHLRRLKVGRRQWRRLLLARPGDLAQVERVHEELQAADNPAHYVIRLKLGTGAGWSAADVERLDRLEGNLKAVGAQVERRGEIRPWVDPQTIDPNGLPAGAIKETLLSLQAEVGQTADESRRQVLAAALQLGWAKVQEASAL